jgi:hypothetical protein
MPILYIQGGNIINKSHETNCACTKCIINRTNGFSIYKWSDDDIWSPITPFLGKNN